MTKELVVGWVVEEVWLVVVWPCEGSGGTCCGFEK